MEIEQMGRVLTQATIENLEDICAQKVGVLKHGRVRQLEIDKALVDSGATLLSIPTRLIRELGLERVSSKRVTSSVGSTTADGGRVLGMIQFSLTSSPVSLHCSL